MMDMSAMFTRFSLNPAKNALAYRTTSNMTSDFPCIPHPFTHIDRTIDAKAENGAGAARFRGKLAGMTTGAARREGARTAPSKQAFETRIKRRHPACAAIPSQKRSPLAQKSAAKTNGGKRNRFPEQTRSTKRPARANPCISIVFSEPRKTGACGAEARMHGLGTLTRGTQRILATSPLRCGLSHKENPCAARPRQPPPRPRQLPKPSAPPQRQPPQRRSWNRPS